LLAKDTLVLVLSYELYGLADSVKTALTNADPFNIGMVIYYITLGYAMPPCIYRKMVEHIKQWFTDSTLENFQQTFPWLLLSGKTWKGIITIMNAWVDPEAHYSPDFPSVTEVLASYRPSGDDRVDNAMAGLLEYGAGSNLVSDMKAKLDSAREQKRAQIADAFKSMTLMPDMIDKAKCALGDDATEEEMRNFLVEIVLDQMLDGGGLPKYVAPMDKLFLEKTKCLYPQYGPSDEINEELSSFVLGNGSKKEATEAMKKYKPHIRKNWVTNPVQVDPQYWYFLNGNQAIDEFNPVREFPQRFLTREVISFMSEPPPDVSSAETDEEKEKVFRSNTLAFNMIRYYWHVGRAVANMLGKTAIEIALGSIISFSSDRECSALPTKYHRITLSNIPDYTGMQSVFITLAPALLLKSNSITPCIQSNNLLNTGLWKSYDDYIFSTTALGYKEAEAVFHLRVSDQEPSIWDTNVWEQAGDNDERVESLSMSHEELCTWFHRIFLMTILPADRDVNSMFREEKASNINLFLLTLSHCVNRLGIPAHFIASVLEDLLKKKTLMTKATLSNDSPALYLDSKDVSKKRYALSAFHTELANQTAIFLQNSLLGFRLLDTSILPTQKASLYELKLGGISPKYEQSWAYKYGSVSSAMSLGFMLQKTTVRGEYDITTAARNNNGMLGGQKKSSKLRRDLLLSGDEIGHVFSCMNWDLSKQTASFWLCEDVFENFSDYHFRLVRTDGGSVFRMEMPGLVMPSALVSFSYKDLVVSPVGNGQDTIHTQ
jgi:hypothetical protein